MVFRPTASSHRARRSTTPYLPFENGFIANWSPLEARPMVRQVLDDAACCEAAGTPQLRTAPASSTCDDDPTVVAWQTQYPLPSETVPGSAPELKGLYKCGGMAMRAAACACDG